MISANRLPLLKGKARTWLTAAGGACLAVAAGVLLPRALAPGAAAQETLAPPKPAREATDLHYQPPAWPDAPKAGPMIGRLVVGTAVVLGLCGLTLWVGKRWLGGTPIGKTGNRHLELVEALPLGKRGCLYLVRTGTSRVVVGMDQAGLKGMVALTGPFEATLDEIEGTDLTAGTGEHVDG